MDLSKLLYFNELKELNLPKNEYVILGSGPLVIRGLRGNNHDIDILVTKKLWNKLIKEYPVKIKEVKDKKREFMKVGNISISYPWDDSNLLKNVFETADVVEGYKFASLEDIKLWKSYIGRDKDIEDVKLIEQYLNKNQL